MRSPKTIAVANNCSVTFFIGAANNLNCPLLDIEGLRHLEKRVPVLFVFAHCGQARGTPGRVFSRMSGFGVKSFLSHTANVGIAGAKRRWIEPQQSPPMTQIIVRYPPVPMGRDARGVSPR